MKDTLKPGDAHTLRFTVADAKTAPNLYPESATPSGMTVAVTATCEAVDGRRVRWRVLAEDECDLIGEGAHDRAVVKWDKFNAKVAEKADRR